MFYSFGGFLLVAVINVGSDPLGIDNIDLYLDDEKLVKLASPSVLTDIFEQKDVIPEEIRGFFNRYTYRIISFKDSYMQPVNVLTSEYFYEGDHFRIHIWTINDVPIRFDFIDRDKILEPNFHKLAVKLRLPFNVVTDNLTIRGIHMSFDHYTEHAKSFEQDVLSFPVANVNAGITDLYACLINEWAMQVDLIKEIRNYLIMKRYDYEEIVKLTEEAQKTRRRSSRSQKGKELSGKKRRKIAAREPPIVTANDYPDVWQDFLIKEQEQYEAFINTVYHPDILKLSEHEINLKKYLILGGIYQFHFVRKPKNTGFCSEKFNMTWHLHKGNLHINQGVLRKDVDDAETTETSLESAPSTEQVDQYDRYFTLTFELPHNLCRWGQPMACHFEASIVDIFEPKRFSQARNKRTSFRQSSNDGSTIGEDKHSDVSKIISSISRPAGSVTNTFHPSLRVSTLNFQVRSSTDSLHDQDLENFILDLPLRKHHISQLQKYCLPHIISSYKFPFEDAIDDDKKTTTAPSRSNKFRRKSIMQDEGSHKMSQTIFTHVGQDKPERIFPLYQNVDFFPSSYGQNPIIALIQEREPETFFELLNVLGNIEKQYKSRYQHTMFLPKFKPPMIKALQKADPKRETTPMVLTKVKRKGSKNTRLSTQSAKFLKSPRSSILSGRTGSVGSDSLGAKKDIGSNTSKKRVHDNVKIEKLPKERMQSFSQYLTESREFIPELQEDNRGINNSVNKQSHWTTEHIKRTDFDKETNTITIWTDRLGTIGFAFERYAHYPFRYWSVERSEDKPDSEIVVTIVTQHVKCVLFVRSDGYRGYATDITDRFVRNQFKYIEIKEPIDDMKELKKRFRDKNLNIFWENDAQFYIKSGYFSEKHIATEMHTYCCMAINAGTMKFRHSTWNRLAKRRDIILSFGPISSHEDEMNLVHITPEGGTFVDVEELCSEDLKVFKLQYNLTWRNLEFYADLHQLISSFSASASQHIVKDHRLIFLLKNLLSEIRPLSFS